VARAVFSPDGKRMAYVADVESMQVAVIEGEAEFCNAVAQLWFSPDSRRVAYVAQRGGSLLAVTYSGR
jgi:hypothetical protein